MAPLSTLLTSALSLFPRAPSAIVPYLTVESELIAYCRRYADAVTETVFPIARSTFNITCWTDSSMQNEKGRTHDGTSLIWAWTPLNENWTDDPPYSRYRAIGPDGKEAKKGCWVNEEQLKLPDVDLTETIKYCGKAPHHQV